LPQEFTPPLSPLLGKLKAAAAIPSLTEILQPLLDAVLSTAVLETTMAEALDALLERIGHGRPVGLPQQIARLQQDERRAKTLPVRGFDRQPLAPWAPPTPQQLAMLAAYLSERAKVTEETRRLTHLFTEALALPAVAAADRDLAL
jgi:hypothetical protein